MTFRLTHGLNWAPASWSGHVSCWKQMVMRLHSKEPSFDLPKVNVCVRTMHFHIVSWNNWTPTFSPRLGTPRLQEFRWHGGSSGVAVSQLGHCSKHSTLHPKHWLDLRAGTCRRLRKDQRWFLVYPLLEGSRKDEKLMSCSFSWCS